MADLGYPEGGSHKPTNLPYAISSEAGLDMPMRPGGDVWSGIALGTLNVGDVVFLSATQDNWTKTNVPANYAGVCGVVVGGFRTYDQVIQKDSAIGTMLAANATERVLVMVFGIAKVVADLALAINAKVTGGSVTAGRVSTTGAVSGNYVGAVLDTAGAAGVVIRLAVNLVA